MKKLIAVLIILISFLGFEKNYAEEKNPASAGIRLADYFPTKPGTELVYRITPGAKDFILWEKIVWPAKNHHEVSFIRYRPSSSDLFSASVAPSPNGDNSGNASRGPYFLKLKIKNYAVQKNGAKLLACVDLAVEHDDIGVYVDAKKVSWSMEMQDNFAWREIIVYPPGIIKSPLGGTEDGHSDSLMFFNGKPGERRPVDKQSKDKLVCIGVEPVPETNISGMHFVKIIKARKSEPDDDEYVNKAFREDAYFVVGKGLVFLEQKVDGKVSMTWRLVEQK